MLKNQYSHLLVLADQILALEDNLKSLLSDQIEIDTGIVMCPICLRLSEPALLLGVSGYRPDWDSRNLSLCPWCCLHLWAEYPDPLGGNLSIAVTGRFLEYQYQVRNYRKSLEIFELVVIDGVTYEEMGPELIEKLESLKTAFDAQDFDGMEKLYAEKRSLISLHKHLRHTIDLLRPMTTKIRNTLEQLG